MSVGQTDVTDLPSNIIESAGPEFRAQRKIYGITVIGKSVKHINEIVDYFIEGQTKPNYSLVCSHQNEPGEDFHYHCLFQYPSNKRVNGKFLFGTYVMERVDSPQGFIDYCKGLDAKHKALGVDCVVRLEEGSIRTNEKTRFKSIAEVERMSVTDRKQLGIQYKNIIDKMNETERRESSFRNMLAEIRDDKLEAPEVYYIEGQPGEGKTYGAYKLALSKFKLEEIGRIKFCNQFAVIDIEDAKCFVIEEFRASDLRASELLQLMDKYGTNVNVKGGFVHLRPKCIIICSIFSPTELYKHDELSDQFIRRLKMKYRAEGHELIEE